MLLGLTTISIAPIGRGPNAEALPAGDAVNAGRADPLAGLFPVIFDSEWVLLHIVGDSLEVRGTYVFLRDHPTAGPFPLFYPFPVDSMLGGARMVSLSARIVPGGGDGTDGPARWEVLPGIGGVRFWMPQCTGDTLVVEAVYRQKILGGYGRYVLTTTRSWDRPLRRARFEIHLPPGASPTEFSFPFEERVEDGDRYYGFEADSFFPDHDIVVRWKRGE